MSDKVDDFLEDNKDLIDDLSKTDTIEYEISSYLIHHQDGLKEEIVRHFHPNYQLFPASFYIQPFKDNSLKIIRENVSKGLNLSPEDTLSITEELVTKCLGNILSPPR